jgi:[ribosomal protein S5]-alanine N-acetyltransferase
VPAERPGEPVPSIRTRRLELVSMSIPFMHALVAQDPAAASREIGAEVPEGMSEDLVDFLRYRLAQLAVDPTILEWLGRAMVLTDEAGTRRVIGTIGFHGAPDPRGRVEVGYRVEPGFRRLGYAREAVLALFDWATATHGIRRYIASVSPSNGPSLALIAGLGFTQTGSQMDDIDGLEHVFEADWPQVQPSKDGVD